ncbi:unnamed protein product [Symbiodinium necroappetens]|uniref:Uncharacterized protein n=1 Tax=Symbiodinium necroappetens TaxID=1628268 RepID=A0A812TBW4_9DINO|nr:unnamed protein product [Symbiodinium necroappetens]
MEGGGVAAKWDPDEDELVPDYASMPVVPEGSGSYPQGSQGMEDTQRVGRCTTHSAAMDVDEPGGEVRLNPAQGLTVEAVVQRQVLSIFQSQVTPLLGQLMDRLEAMEARQSAERTAPHTTIEATTLGQDALAGDFQKMMSLGVESVASERQVAAICRESASEVKEWSLAASTSDPTHNPCSHAVVAAAPEVPQAPGERLPSLPAPPEVPSEMRGTGLRVEGDSFANDESGGQGTIGGRSEGRDGFDWFYNGLKRVFASHSGEHDGRAEEVKTSTAELQQLVINDGDKDVSPLLAGDWLTLAGLHLILKAIPNSLKEELVSTQRMSCIDAVAKIFCTYQWYRRAEDLQVSLPDSTLLLAGLDLLTSKALSKFPAELEVLDTGVAKGCVSIPE